jgi:hypothetical protein
MDLDLTSSDCSLFFPLYFPSTSPSFSSLLSAVLPSSSLPRTTSPTRPTNLADCSSRRGLKLRWLRAHHCNRRRYFRLCCQVIAQLRVIDQPCRLFPAHCPRWGMHRPVLFRVRPFHRAQRPRQVPPLDQPSNSLTSPASSSESIHPSFPSTKYNDRSNLVVESIQEVPLPELFLQA